MFFPNNVSDQSISVFFNGRMCSIPASDPNFKALSEHLKEAEHSYAVIENLVDKPKMIARLTEGLVTVVGSTVYYEGTPVHSTMAYRLLDILNAGQNAKVWARFIERVMANPSDRSRKCLYDFLNVWKAPLTEDGCFIAFKRVRADYKDIHSGTFDNSPGNTISMDRSKVNDDPDVYCSYGLHVAASSYLGHFATAYENRTLACKVDPADVVAVPGDYGFSKMRVCKYIVLGDAEESFYNNAEASPVYQPKKEPVELDSWGEPVEYEDEDDIPYCAMCGSCEVDSEDEWCDSCEQEEEDERQEAFDAECAEMERQDTIAETGVTPDGVLVDEARAEAYEAEQEQTFERAGKTYTQAQITEGGNKGGQRGYSGMTGVPRTLQDWIAKFK